MPAPTPPVTIAKPPAGVLPISAVKSKPDAPNKNSGQRPPASKTKLVIRRLPPGLRQEELEQALGEEWKSGKGKVNWTLFKLGKLSQDLSKPSRPARAYLQVTDHAHVEPLARKVNTTTFTDARGTSNDPALIGPPCLEYAPYSRVPGGKRRNDARQGTIDQDPEFIEFLESLTNPITKPKAIESDSAKDEPVTVTPLIQHLRDKKAAKERAPPKQGGKHARQESKDLADGKGDKKATAASKDSAGSANRPAVRAGKENEKVGKNAVKSPNRDGKAPSSKQQDAASDTTATAATSAASKKDPAGTKPQSRASASSAAARMIQRDLGLRGGKRGGRADSQARQQSPDTKNSGAASATEPSAPQPAKIPQSAASAKPTPNGPATNAKQTQPSTANRAQPNQPQPPAQPKAAATPAGASPGPASSGRKPPKATTDPTATRAFLKHANPSQGITEDLLRAAVSAHGAVTHVEIDKRKGFAYVDFADPAGLKAAIAASPIAVAQGSVQVLERNDRSRAPAAPAGPAAANAPARGARGGGPAANFRGRGRGGATGRGGFARGAGSTAGSGASNGAGAETPLASAAGPAPTSSHVAGAGGGGDGT